LFAVAGMLTNNMVLQLTGYIGYALVILRFLFHDLIFLDVFERNIAFVFTIAGIIILQRMVGKTDNVGLKLYSVAGFILGVIWIAREVYSLSYDIQTLHIVVSFFWAIFAISLIVFGIVYSRKLYNWSGVILFFVVVLKVLLVDTAEVENVLRIVILIVVGVLALLGAYLYTQNKDKLKGVI